MDLLPCLDTCKGWKLYESRGIIQNQVHVVLDSVEFRFSGVISCVWNLPTIGIGQKCSSSGTHFH